MAYDTHGRALRRLGAVPGPEPTMISLSDPSFEKLNARELREQVGLRKKLQRKMVGSLYALYPLYPTILDGQIERIEERIDKFQCDCPMHGDRS